MFPAKIEHFFNMKMTRRSRSSVSTRRKSAMGLVMFLKKATL